MFGGVWLLVLLSVLAYIGFWPFSYKPVNSAFAFLSLNEIGSAPALFVKKDHLPRFLHSPVTVAFTFFPLQYASV